MHQVWAPNGSDGLHPQLTRGGQLELMQAHVSIMHPVGSNLKQ